MTPSAVNPVMRLITLLQADEAGWSALEAAARMAKGLEAELLALFLEDGDLFAAADLPFTRAISAETGALRDFDAVALEAAYKVQAARARERVSSIGALHSLRWSFEMLRRDSEHASRLATRGGDILFVDRATLGLRYRRTGIETTAQLECHLLVADVRSAPPHHIGLVYEGRSEVLRASFRISAALGAPLDVLVIGEDAESLQRLMRRARDWLRRRGVTARIAGAVAIDTEALRQFSATHSDGLLLFDRPSRIATLTG